MVEALEEFGFAKWGLYVHQRLDPILDDDVSELDK